MRDLVDEHKFNQFQHEQLLIVYTLVNDDDSPVYTLKDVQDGTLDDLDNAIVQPLLNAIVEFTNVTLRVVVVEQKKSDSDETTSIGLSGKQPPGMGSGIPTTCLPSSELN